MKKLLIASLTITSASVSFAAIGGPGDLVQKRQNMAAQAAIYATQLDNALNGLAGIKAERAKLSQDFQDSDFTRPDIKHMDAGMVGTCLDFVVPSFQTTYTDQGNGGRNGQIILQMRNGTRFP